MECCSLGRHRTLRSVRRSNVGGDRKTWAQFRGESWVIESDLHGNSLDNFGEISRGVVGRKERKLRAACWSDFENFSPHDLSGVLVDVDFCGVTHLHVGELRFAIVGLNPLD